MDPVLACSLSPTDLEQRMSEWGALREAQLERRTTPGRFSAWYVKRPDVAERLAQLVEAERECCPFLTIELRDEGELIAVEVAAPAGAEAALPEF